MRGLVDPALPKVAVGQVEVQARRHPSRRRDADGGECVVIEPGVLAQRHLVPGDLVGELGLAVGEVVREHAAPGRVVVGRDGPLLEQQLAPIGLALLRLRDRLDDTGPVAHVGRLRPTADKTGPSRLAASVRP